MVAAAEKIERAGNEAYQRDHMRAIFKEGFSFSGFERDMLALNLGQKRYLDISGISGVDSISDGRGSLFADLDNDGDPDVLLSAAQGEAHYLFRNNVGHRSKFLRVDLVGTRRGRDAYGAVVRVKTSAGVLTKVKAGGSGYLSQGDPRLLFGLGQDDRAEWVEVTWPTGVKERHGPVAAGVCLRLVEGQPEPRTIVEKRFSLVDPLSRQELALAKLGLRKGQAFPDLALRDLAGRDLKFRALVRPGRRYLVNLWATYCVPCAKEMPELQALYPELEQAGIELFGVSIDTETVDQVPGYLEQRGIRYPVYTTEEASIRRIFTRGEVMIPMSFLLDDRGRVLEVFIGWSEEARASMHALIGARREPRLAGDVFQTRVSGTP